MASEAAHRRRAEAGFVLTLAGGVASFADDQSPFNKVAGLGFDGVPTSDELAEMERAFAAVGSPAQVELSELADPALGSLLTGRGYRLEGFENVLGRDLGGPIERVRPAGVGVRPSDDLEAWIEVVLEGVAHPDTQGLPSHEEFPREAVEAAERDLVAAGAACYLALVDGAPAGGGSLRMAHGIAQLTGAATAPAYRRRGVQAALLSARLADAAAAGCEIAVVTTQPGSKSQENVQRRGFELLYARAILVKTTTAPSDPARAPRESRPDPRT
jgi:GNAT superfamily N-acetyltransferase